ncbi:hypothetical protein H5410_032977 [Solanum commersonii]|uniref:Uncharacterized protein n=1 Tax=Solanum commersonii TaxID=4109 RepID=A0A9J5YPE6_SOLCO|nr:hypothetical protein H5410_032977 [Solanum commersonii]
MLGHKFIEKQLRIHANFVALVRQFGINGKPLCPFFLLTLGIDIQAVPWHNTVPMRNAYIYIRV